jgi:hypothetical protein
MKAKKVIRVWNPVQKLKSTKGGIVVSKGLRGNGKWAEKTVCHFLQKFSNFAGRIYSVRLAVTEAYELTIVGLTEPSLSVGAQWGIERFPLCLPSSTSPMILNHMVVTA